MMTRREANIGLISTAALAAMGSVAVAEEPAVIELPEPQSQGGKPLIEALRLRRSIRDYSSRALPPQVLSDLLWAAFGINRPATGDRTAPYWRHVMVIDIYAAMADGVWIYETKEHKLLRHSPGDIRAKTGTQDFVAGAPLNLVYVAHGERMGDIAAETSGFTPPSMPALSVRTSVYSAHRRGWRRYSGPPFHIANWQRLCAWVPGSSSPLPRRWDIRPRLFLSPQ
jgi:Nitroreductase family